MSTTSYHHGATVTEVDGAPIAISEASTAVIGFVATASDADETAFPLNTPVLITSPQTGLAKAGTSGTLGSTLQAIANHISSGQIVVVRVEEGDDADGTNTNVIGGTDENGAYTGMKALLVAKSRLGVTPKILGAPGLDTQPVATALVSVAQQLRAMIYAGCNGCATLTDATAYRENFSARELMLIWPNFQAFDTASSSTVELPAAAVALGLRAKLDQTQGWHRVLSNIAANGVTGISKDVFFDYLSTGTDADTLNQAGVTTLVNQSGFRFWGSRTCGEADSLFVFESYTRTAQQLIETIGNGVFAYTDKPLHASLVRDIIESINALGRQMVAAGELLGFKAWFDAAKNDPAAVQAGTLAISYQYTPVPPLENLKLVQSFTDTYFATLVSDSSAA